MILGFMSGNDEDKIVGYKYLQSYPYDTPQFKIGDYIHWNFNHKELSTWILTSLDTEYLYNVKGRMLECNNSLRWTDSNGELNCYPCVVKDALTYTNFKWGSKGVVEPGADIVVIVQKNDYTSAIGINDRFIFNGKGFRVKADFNHLNPNYVELYMSKAPELEGDDLSENIAINEEPEPKVQLSGNVISPEIDSILLGETQEFSVYNYKSNVKGDDKFTITLSGVPSKYYSFSTTDSGAIINNNIIINANTFTIENLKQYQNNTLTIKCVNETTNEETNKQVWLGGGW